MKTRLAALGWLLAAFVVGTAAGAAGQYLLGGHWYEVQRTESYPLGKDKVVLTYATESFGMPFLEPETSILALRIQGELPIVIYKAKATFQESGPTVRDVATAANRVTWQDGIRRYSLTVDPVGCEEDRE